MMVEILGPYDYLFTLGSKTFRFAEHSVKIARDKPENLNSWELARIEAQPDEDGYLYFIEAKPLDVGLLSFVGLSKEEAFSLNKTLKRVEAEYVFDNNNAAAWN